jgi:hypothetical protein
MDWETVREIEQNKEMFYDVCIRGTGSEGFAVNLLRDNMIELLRMEHRREKIGMGRTRKR